MNKLSFHIENTVNFPNSVNEIKYQLLDAIAYFNTNKEIIIGELMEVCKNKTSSQKFYRPNLSKSYFNNKRHILTNGLEMHKYFFKVNNFFKEINGLWKFLISDTCKSISSKSSNDNCWLGNKFKK